MHEDARALLDQIDEFLLRNNDASKDFAAVITAIRSEDGSDDDDTGIEMPSKMRTTIPIRRAAFPKCAAFVDAHVMHSVHVGKRRGLGMRTYRHAQPDCTKVVIHAKNDGKHFQDHVVEAAQALGLKIDYKD